MIEIKGQCHCENITYTFHWPGDERSIPVRACSCSFCTMHGGVYTSHREGELHAKIQDDRLLNRYRFGTSTADFYICARCGVVPFVVSEINDHQYAVVNVNTFTNVDRAIFQKAVTDFDGETTENRLERRERTWIPSVAIDRYAHSNKR